MTAHIAGFPVEEAVVPVLSLLAAARVYVSTRRPTRTRVPGWPAPRRHR